MTSIFSLIYFLYTRTHKFISDYCWSFVVVYNIILSALHEYSHLFTYLTDVVVIRKYQVLMLTSKSNP